jgi:hypothetical protein
VGTESLPRTDDSAHSISTTEAAISTSAPLSLTWRALPPIFAIVALCAVVGIFPIETEDVFSHVVTGGYLWQHRHVPSVDPFSYTGPHKWLLSHPLLPLFFFAAHATAGVPGIQIVCAIVVALTYSLSYCIWERRTEMPLTSFVAVGLAILCSCYWFDTLTYCFGYLLAAVYLLLITSSSRRAILWTIPLQVVWANTHPSAAIGVLLVTVWCVGRAHILKQIDCHGATVTLSVLAANILNPSGVAIYQRMFDALRSHQLSPSDPLRSTPLAWLAPWDPLVASEPQSCWFFASLIITALLVRTQITYWQRIKNSQNQSRQTVTLLATAALLALSLVSSRHIPIYYLCLLGLALTTFKYVVSQPSGEYVRAIKQHYRIISWGVVCGTTLLIVRMTLFGYLSGDVDRRIGFGIHARTFPDKPIQILKDASLEGNVFTEHSSGSYFLYQAFPRYKVFLDSTRLGEVYSDSFFAHYLLLENHVDVLRNDIARYDMRAFILPLPRSEISIPAMHRLLSADPAWKLAYFDDSYMLFIQADEARARNIPTFSHLNPFANILQLIKRSPEVDAPLFEDLNRARQIAPTSISVLVLHVLYHLAKGDMQRAKESALQIENFCQKYDPTTECRKIASPQLARFREILG